MVSCLHRFWGSLDEDRKGRLSAKDQQVLNALLKVKPHQVVYRLTRAEKGEKLKEFGVLLSRLQATYIEQDSDHYGVMVRVFGDQITVISSPKDVLPKPPDEISAS